MKVILTQDVNKVGARGDMVEVADGYGRNFLIKKGLAVEGTGGKLREWEENQKAKRNREAKLEQEAIETRKKIGGKKVSVTVNAGEEGRLFGSVTASQIADAIAERFGVAADKRDIKLDAQIKQVGDYPCKIRLYTGVEAELTLEVRAE
jgi:large subunit ribosomal protein L9